MEEYKRERITRILRSNQVRERHRDLLCRGEAVFAIKDHGVRAVEHEHSCARRLVFALVDLQIMVLEIQRKIEAFPLNGAGESRGNVEVQRVAELILLGGAASLDAGCHIARVVPAEAGFPERSE